MSFYAVQGPGGASLLVRSFSIHKATRWAQCKYPGEALAVRLVTPAQLARKLNTGEPLPIEAVKAARVYLKGREGAKKAAARRAKDKAKEAAKEARAAERLRLREVQALERKQAKLAAKAAATKAANKAAREAAAAAPVGVPAVVPMQGPAVDDSPPWDLDD